MNRMSPLGGINRGNARKLMGAPPLDPMPKGPAPAFQKIPRGGPNAPVETHRGGTSGQPTGPKIKTSPDKMPGTVKRSRWGG